MTDLAKIEAEVIELRKTVRELLWILEERLPEQSEPSQPSLTLVKGERDA